uniref:Uncharacterized protein LOC113798106 n=1 Tax=Dermatophagoides pteronyssinus TaxID=6956 RepID=A0A6P6YHZ3_DERPT|nr:uncharacterized protein LOC113798106 [Dermatophagoides pteronyssinus]
MLPENIDENQIKNWAQNELNLDLNEALIHEMLKKRCLQQVLSYVVCKVKNKRNAQKFFNHATMRNVSQQIDVNNQQFKDVINDYNNEPVLFQSEMIENFDKFYAEIAKSNHTKTMIDKFDCHSEIKNIDGLIEQLRQKIESMETNVFKLDSEHSLSEDSTTEIAKILDINLKNISDLYQMIRKTSKENMTKINQLDDVQIESSDTTATMNDLKDRLHRIRSSTLSWMAIIDNFTNKN